MLEDFTVRTFSEHLGSTFRVYPNPSGSLEVELISATDLSEESDRGRPFLDRVSRA